VAFCTQNIVPGIDFSNDPLLAGRNFSYLDTQLKRLGGPNFTQLPINAPKCPFAHFQQDGHMALTNPRGRINYEPNSYGAQGGPREDPGSGFKSFPAEEQGQTLRVRPELFADHYSQARQFYISQTELEQVHIAKALIFELSKVENPLIRVRMLAHLLNIDEELAQTVATGLGVPELPEPAEAARPTREDLDPSPALSILGNPAGTFKGRKLGVLLTDGADSALLEALQRAFVAEGAVVELIAPQVGGTELSDGSKVPAKQQLEGAPSVLYDAVALLLSEQGADQLLNLAPARDFVADAFAHNKLIAYTSEAKPLLVKAGIAEQLDEGTMELNTAQAVAKFLKACRALRFWERQAFEQM
jgi:catalase